MRGISRKSVAGSAVILLGGLAGCGGGGPANTGAPSASTTTVLPQGRVFATARIDVDVAHGRVTFIPIGRSARQARSTRAVFASGTPGVTFDGLDGTAVLTNDPGDPQLKTFTVSITNNFGVDIGRLPNGAATGLLAVLNSIAITSTSGTVNDAVTLSNPDGVIPHSAPEPTYPT